MIYKRLWFLLVALPFVLVACNNDNDRYPLPNVYVNEMVSLNTYQALPLRYTDGNYIYIKGGIKGIVLYRENANSFKAYDRACPYAHRDSCSGLVTVHSSRFFLQDTCCGSQFDLLSGGARSGPAIFPLRMYNVARSNDQLYITNQ